MKDQLAELEQIIEDVTKYFPDHENVARSRKTLAFKHIDSLLLPRNVRVNMKKLGFAVCVKLAFNGINQA